jgi:hypothetical protein
VNGREAKVLKCPTEDGSPPLLSNSTTPHTRFDAGDLGACQACLQVTVSSVRVDRVSPDADRWRSGRASFGRWVGVPVRLTDESAVVQRGWVPSVRCLWLDGIGSRVVGCVPRPDDRHELQGVVDHCD